MVVVDCENKFRGSWSALADFNPSDSKTRSAIEFIRSSVQEDHSSSNDTDKAQFDSGETSSEAKAETSSRLMTVEQREHGLSSLSTWLLWFHHAGGVYFMGVLLLLLAIDRFLYVALEYWLARWTQGAFAAVAVFGIEFPPQTDGLEAQFRYLSVYSLILLLALVFTFLRSEWSVTGGSRAAKNVFSSMLSSVLGSPMSYFETTPMGRILNRFTYDMEVVDVVLTQNMSMFLISMSWYVAGVCVMAVSTVPCTRNYDCG
jgi:hypothetical protein